MQHQTRLTYAVLLCRQVRRVIFAVFAILLLVGLLWGPTQARSAPCGVQLLPQQKERVAGSKSNLADTTNAPRVVEIILDVSGSMWGRIGGIPKIGIARTVLGNLIDELPETTRVGLLAYGHRRKGDCSDLEQLVPIGPLDRVFLKERIAALAPKGKTPITKAIGMAIEKMRSQSGEKTIVLISDGKETCGGDPCRFTGNTKAKAVDFVAHVVGFDVNNEERDQLSCIARESGGIYIDARSASELAQALQATAKRSPKASVVPLPGNTYDVDVVNQIAYVLGNDRLVTVDVRDPAQPKVLGETGLGKGWTVRVSESVAYVASGTSGLTLVDVCDPFSPQVIERVPTPEYALAVEVDAENHLAYVGLGTTYTDSAARITRETGGIQVVDVHDPSAATTLAYLDMGQGVVDLRVQGNYLFAAHWRDGIAAVDIDNPSKPELKQVLQLTGIGVASSIAVQGNRAFVVGSSGPPANPIVKEYDSIATTGHLNLATVDITNPDRMKQMGLIKTVGSVDGFYSFANGIVLDGNRAHVVDSTAGIQIIDVSDVSKPVLKTAVPTKGFPRSIDKEGNWIYVTHSEGIEITQTR